MTTYTTHTAGSPRLGHLRAHLRAYVVGVGATTALTAGALVAFLSLATFVAFKGLPLGGSSNDAGAAYLGANPTTAPTAAAAALGAAHAAVAKGPASGSPAAGSGPGGGSSVVGGRSGGGGNSPGGDLPGGGSNPPGGSGGGGSPIPGVPLPPASSGPVTHAVQGVDNAAGTNLSGPTSGATRAVDGAAGGGLNRVGGAVGHPHLGHRVGGAVSGVTDRVLGG
jgi:hypothetical protein